MPTTRTGGGTCGRESGSIPRGFQEDKNMRSVALWLLGVPIGVIILLNVFGLLGH
jgi:hypothetical protein